MILVLALAVFAQAPAVMPRIEDVSERRVFEEAQRALEADEGLLALHRGLRAYVSADDDLRQAEEAYDALMELPTVRERVEDFEEVLIVDTAARADYQRYLARVQRDPTLRDAVEALGAIEAEKFLGSRDAAKSFAYLRAHPSTAIQFLMERDRGQAGLEVLRPLRDAFRANSVLQVRLREAWTTLDAQAGAREAVYPWWARAYGGSTAAAQRYRTLEAELTPPSRRRMWETRELAWAARSEAVAWRDHVYARVRRDPALGQIYFSYLRTLRMLPDVERYAEDAFAAKHGAPPVWPPEGAPPSLPSWQRHEPIVRPGKPAGPSAPSLKEPGIEGPKAPTVDRPAAPVRPIAPERTKEPSASAEPLTTP